VIGYWWLAVWLLAFLVLGGVIGWAFRGLAIKRRDCAEDLDVLARHRPCVGHCETVPEDNHQAWCHRCSTGQLPCPEVLSLGRRYGITEEGEG
jgi:hypothetical protein